MDPMSIILAALGTGAAAGATGVAKSAITDAYQALKSRIQKKFAGKQAAEVALEQHETDPETWKEPLKKALTDTQADQDPEILTLAQHILELSRGQSPLISHQVSSSGERSIAIGGNVSDSEVSTGDSGT